MLCKNDWRQMNQEQTKTSHHVRVILERQLALRLCNATLSLEHLALHFLRNARRWRCRLWGSDNRRWVFLHRRGSHLGHLGCDFCAFARDQLILDDTSEKGLLSEKGFFFFTVALVDGAVEGV